MVPKGAFLHHFASNKDATKRVRGRKGIMKDPGMKELAKTISNKARKRIAIVAMLIIELKSHYQFIFLFLIWAPRVCQFTDEVAVSKV